MQLTREDPIFANHHKFYEMTPKEKKLYQFKKLNQIWNKYPEKRKEFFQGYDRPDKAYSYYTGHGQGANVLHRTMFCQSMKTFCTKEQLKVWQPLLENYDIHGCYAQTEIGHGSDISALKTTATFDKEKDEFVLHTPTIDATKWWPGELGGTANFAIVFARCLIPEEDGQVNDYGIQPFIVQIRDRDTHKHMPGIKTGEIGPKFGYAGKDNGWMTMDSVRIPRSQMLQRFLGVDRDGSIQMGDNPKIMFSVMMNIRTEIVLSTKYAYMFLLVLAIRYSVVRR